MDDFRKMLQTLTADDFAFLPSNTPAAITSPNESRSDKSGSDEPRKIKRKRRSSSPVLNEQTPKTIEQTSPPSSPQADGSHLESEGEPAAQAPAAPTVTVSDASNNENPDAGEGPRKRRNCPEHEWPPVGTVLTADYFGVTYTAEVVVVQKRLKSGRQIRLLDGPARGKVFDSLSRAMLAATTKQRKNLNLGRKGVASGWEFWGWDGKRSPASLSSE